MDDVAIGGGAGNQMQGKTAADTADHSGPLEQRIVSKNWNVRAQAYDDLNKMSVNASIDSKEPFFQEHVDQFKVYLKDSNPGALEKALDCLVNFLNKIQAKVLIDAQNGIIQIIIEKMLLTHAKPGIKAKSLESLLLLFEVTQNFEDSQETLLALLKHKNVKVLANAILGLAAMVKNYGVKKIRIADYAEIMLKNAQHTNPDCKKNSYEYYRSVYKWIGDAILPQIEEKLKKTQMKCLILIDFCFYKDDLKKIFEQEKASGDKSKRLTRKEKKAEEERLKNEAIDAAIAAEEGAEAVAEGQPPEEEAIDPLEFAPVKDILSEFNGDWMDKTAGIKKWNEKKEQLDKVVEACKNCKIKPGNFGPMTAFLNKEIRATNVNTATAAINVVAAIANGLKKDFSPYAKEVVEGILLKYKEKKITVVEACNQCCDALLNSCSLIDISEQIIPCITNVAPGVKNGTIKFVEKHIVITYIDVLQKVSDELLPAIKKVMDDKDGTVRDNALHCMGVLKGRLSDQIMQPYIKDLNPQKSEKLNEAAKEIKPSKYDRPENWKPPPKKLKPEPKKTKKGKNEDDDIEMTDDFKPPTGKKPPNIGKKPPSKIQKTSGGGADDEKKTISDAAPQKKPAGSSSTKGPTAPIIADENLGAGMDADQAQGIVEDNFESSTVKAFSSAKWQEKVQGFEGLQNEIREKQFEANVLEAVAAFIKNKMKDYKESNINLQKGTIATFQVMAQETQALSKRAMVGSMNFFTDKIGDVKLSKLIFEMLFYAAELVTPQFITSQIIKYGATAKAPNTIKDGCNFITQLIQEFGPLIPLKETIDFAKVAAAHATPAVRQAAMKLFKEMYKHIGEALRNFMTEIKESTLKLIDAELKQVTQYGKGEHQPTRQLRGAAAEANKGKGNSKGGNSGGSVQNILDSLPRQDISKKLTSKLLEQYNHKDWKVRKKCGDDIEAILKEAKMRIEPNGTNEMMDVMKKSMKDANKSVVKVFIILLGQLAEAMGAPISKYQKKCFVPMLGNLSDKQQLVRDEVIKCMNKWSDAIGANKVINHLSDVILVENPEARTEGLKWILLHESSVSTSDTQTLVKPLVACLTDKSKDIRTLAENVSKSVMAITGHPSFLNATKDRPAAVQNTLKPILERIKNECSPPAQPASKDPPPGAKKPVDDDQNDSFPSSFQPKPKLKPKAEDDEEITKPKLKQSKDDDDELVIQPTNKRKREQYDSKTKYPLNEVQGDHIQRLQEECFKIFGQKFSDLMFTKNTEFQKHIKCVEMLEKAIETHQGELIEILDIIFKWGNFRMSDSSNTKLIGAFFDFYQKLLDFLIEQDYQMAEFEIVVLLGTFCDKTGQNIKIMAEKAKKLAEICYKVYEPKQCFKLIMQHGVGSKNLKAVAECLDIVAVYVKDNGVETITKKDFAIFLEKANSSDKNVRENSLRVFAETYKVLQEDIWRLLGQDINGKVKGLLEQRFKQLNIDDRAVKSSRGRLMDSKRSNQGSKGPNPPYVPPKPDPVQEITDMVSNQNLESDLPNRQAQNSRFRSRSRSPSQQTGQKNDDKPIQPVTTNQRDVQMQDEFYGRAEQPNQQNQQDHQMKNEKNEPDDVAQVVTQKQRPVDIDAALDRAILQLETDPELRQAMEKIQKHIDQLKVGDLLKRVDSLVALNEVISATSNTNEPQEESSSKIQQKALIRLCDKLINAFTQVMIDIFSFPVKEIPLRFTKYFITIVNKTCSSKEIMKEVSCDEVQGLVDQLLQRLLIENLDKIGQNKEGELILKNLNSSMLRMLENCNHTFIFVVLFGLLTKYKDSTDQPKIPSLIIKCLLKLSKNMDKLIEKVDLKRFMVAIHEYLVTIPLDKKSQNDDLGTRIAKTLVNEIVKLKRNEIWEYYQVIEQHPQPDNHLQKWIQIILKSLSQNIAPDQSIIDNMKDITNSTQKTKDVSSTKFQTDFEMKKIVQDLKEGNNYTHAIQRLDKFIKNNQNYNWKNSLAKEGFQFTQKVTSDLDRYRKGQLELSQNNTSHLSGVNTSMADPKQQNMSLQERMDQARFRQSELNNSMTKHDAFNYKMNRFKKRDSIVQEPVRGFDQNQSTQNALNTSISEMNKNLSNRWAQINQKGGGLTGRETMSGSNTLANTMRNTTASTPGGNNLLNTSSGGFKNRLQNKFANKQQNPNNSSMGENGPETGTIGQKMSPQKLGGMQQVNSQAQLNRSSNAGGISNKSFRDRLKGIKSAQTNQQNSQPGGLANTQVVGGNNMDSGLRGAATNQDLQRRLADMKAKLHGLRNNNN